MTLFKSRSIFQAAITRYFLVFGLLRHGYICAWVVDLSTILICGLISGTVLVEDMDSLGTRKEEMI